MQRLLAVVPAPGARALHLAAVYLTEGEIMVVSVHELRWPLDGLDRSQIPGQRRAEFSLL